MYKSTRCLSFLIALMFLSCGKDTPQPEKPSQPEPTKPIVVSSIEVENRELTMKPGQKSTLSYTVLPVNATDKEVEIISSNADIISVSGKELTAIKIGKATITITSKSVSVSAKINVEVTPIDAAELKLDKSEINMLVGDKETLVATITPEDASEKELTWKSGDEKVANVSATGEVEAVGPGETEITVSTKDGKLSATAKVTVTAKTVYVKSITLKPTELSLTVGSSSPITATVLPANATDKTLEWKSSAATIASVDSKGEVKALKAGSAVITASTKDGKITATTKVTVTAKMIAVESISVKPTDLSLTVGSSSTISATVLPANATDKTVKWKSSVSTIASVDAKGVVKALKIGTAVITASSKDGEITASTKVSVNAKSVSVESITLNSTELSLIVGSSNTIAAAVLPANATNKTVKWTSSAPTIASVDSKGLVKALKVGTAIITASSKDGKASTSAKVSVTAKTIAVESISVKPSDLSLTVGSSSTITATVLPANATDNTLGWKSSAATIASVDSKGVVKALKPGSAVITASTKDGIITASTKVLVTAKVVSVESIKLNPTEVSLTVGTSSTIVASVLPANATDKTLQWKSSGATIASVDSRGVVKALKAGSAVITASTKDGKVTSTAKVVVTALNVAVESITLKPNDIAIAVLSSTTISATVLPANATNKTLKWSSSAPTIATVDSKGLVKALKIGTTVITASTADGKVSAKTNVVVNPILVTSIVLEPRNIIMPVQSTQQISATVLPSNASDKALKWSSNVPSIVSVDSKGIVKALKAGTAVITASTADGKIRNTVTVQVKDDVSFLKGKLSFSLVSNQFVTIGMQVYMSNQSNKAITIKKVEAYSDGALAATALSDFTQTIPALTDEQWVIGFSQTRYSPVIGNFPPNWHAKVYFTMNGQNYAITITNSGSSVQPIHQSTIGLNPDWDGENTTEIPSK